MKDSKEGDCLQNSRFAILPSWVEFFKIFSIHFTFERHKNIVRNTERNKMAQSFSESDVLEIKNFWKKAVEKILIQFSGI